MHQQLLSDETLIGPWGVVGWTLFLLMAGLYIHLWRSSGPTNMRMLNKRLGEASQLIGKLQEENLSLQNRNDHLRTTLNKLQEQVDKGRQNLASLAKANEGLRDTVGRLSLRLEESDKKSAEWYGRVMKLEAQAGIIPDQGKPMPESPSPTANNAPV